MNARRCAALALLAGCAVALAGPAQAARKRRPLRTP